MRLVSWMLMKYRARRTLRRMGRLVDKYRACMDCGDEQTASMIHEDIIMLDRHLTKLLDWWEAEVQRRKAVRS